MSERIDHRQIADEMEIYFLDPQIGAGLPVWLPNGVAIRDSLESYIKELERRSGYQRVASPHIGKSDLYQASGHLKAFDGNMFPPMRWPAENSEYYLKPMNCPHHHKAFAALPRSYRQLPLRIAEYGQVYRFENSGSLKGLSRVRGLCQNDAHIYIERHHAADEVRKVLELHEHCYKALGISGYRYRLSKCDPLQMNHYDGSPSDWANAEEILRQSLVDLDLPFFEAIGEAAFYGPKIDVQMVFDGGEESISSVQLDFNSGEKFELRFIASDGSAQVPWVIHRAPFGSHERFVAMLLEVFQGQLPGWLAPIQVYLVPVSDAQREFCEELQKRLEAESLRVFVDHSLGSLSKRILFAHRYRPFSKVVIGAKEVASNEFLLQLRDKEVRLNEMGLIQHLKGVLKSPNFD